MKVTTDRPYFWLFATLALVGFATDQASKYVVFARLYPPDRHEVIVPELFELRTAYDSEKFSGDGPLAFLRTISGECIPHVNRGALFGMGNEGGGMNSVFAGISMVAACFIVFWAGRPVVAQDRWLCLALGLILAGTLGNFYDRIVFSGVRDFLHFDFGFWPVNPWPTFNIADCCLVCGAGVLMVHSLFAKDPAAEPAKTEAVAENVGAPMQTASPSAGT